AWGAGIGHRLEQRDRPVNSGLLVLAAQRCGARVDPLKPRCMLVELTRVGRAEQRLIEHGDIGDAADGPLEVKTLAFPELTLPAAFGLLRKRIEAARDVSCR